MSAILNFEGNPIYIDGLILLHDAPDNFQPTNLLVTVVRGPVISSESLVQRFTANETGIADVWVPVRKVVV